MNKSPVKWCEKFENIQVEYEQGIPKNADYWTNIEKNTLGSKLFFSIFTIFSVILDDLWNEASNSNEVSNAFKIYARKRKYSLLVITQSFFENGRFGKIIRY